MTVPYPIPSPPPDWLPDRTPRAKVDPAAAKTVTPLRFRFRAAVVGCSFAPAYPENLLALRRPCRNGSHGIWDGTRTCMEDCPEPPMRATMLVVRDAGNEHDPNAVAVRSVMGQHLGHLPRALAAKIAPMLDGGGRYRIAGYRVNVGWRDQTKPGLEVDIVREGDPT